MRSWRPDERSGSPRTSRKDAKLDEQLVLKDVRASGGAVAFRLMVRRLHSGGKPKLANSMRLTERIIVRLLPAAGYLVIKLIGATQRTRMINLNAVKQVFARGGCAIFAFWHNRMMMIPYIYRRLFGMKDIVTLISSSKDGEYFVRALKLFRPFVVRGSSTRGGSAAFKALVRRIREGMDCIITPDGPQGPRYSVQPGIIALARVTGVPIIPVSYWSSRRKVLNTWDGFLVTLPFGKTTYVFGDPLHCPANATELQMEALAHSLEGALLAASRSAGDTHAKPL